MEEEEGHEKVKENPYSTSRPSDTTSARSWKSVSFQAGAERKKIVKGKNCDQAKT